VKREREREVKERAKPSLLVLSSNKPTSQPLQTRASKNFDLSITLPTEAAPAPPLTPPSLPAVFRNASHTSPAIKSARKGGGYEQVLKVEKSSRESSQSI